MTSWRRAATTATCHTTTGEPVRNRELWTVTGVGDDGGLTVSSHLGSGAVTLPVDYVGEHVRLGYAATEHGNQSDTVTIGVELATAATTRRGLYVAVTRGEQENLILVVTDGRDLDQARDILEGVVASDRADIPATTQRRELADTDRAPHRHQPALQPRCEIPAWFEPLRTRVRDDLADSPSRRRRRRPTDPSAASRPGRRHPGPRRSQPSM